MARARGAQDRIRKVARQLCAQMRDCRRIDDGQLYVDCYRNSVKKALADLSRIAQREVAVSED